MEPKDQDPKATRDQRSDQNTGFNPMMMGMSMMRKMMAQMGSSGEGPMAMMQKMMGQTPQGKPGAESESPMQHMMGMCMGMCAEMLNSIEKTTTMATFATPELHAVFSEWLESLEGKAVSVLKERGELEPEQLAEALKISPSSACYLLGQLVREGKVTLRARLRTAPGSEQRK